MITRLIRAVPFFSEAAYRLRAAETEAKKAAVKTTLNFGKCIVSGLLQYRMLVDIIEARTWEIV